MSQAESILIRDIVESEAIELHPDKITDYDPLIDFIGDARFVLLGESSHGSHEFYRERGQITKRLISEK